MSKLTSRTAIPSIQVDGDLLIHVVDLAGPTSYKMAISELSALFSGNLQEVLDLGSSATAIASNVLIETATQSIDLKAINTGAGNAGGTVQLAPNFSGLLNLTFTHSAGNYKSIQLDQNNITVTDVHSSKGMIYAADYSSNFVDRSLIDKAYADALGLTIGNSISGGAANRLLFENGSNQLAQDANVTYDGTQFIVNNGGGIFGATGSLDTNEKLRAQGTPQAGYDPTDITLVVASAATRFSTANFLSRKATLNTDDYNYIILHAGNDASSQNATSVIGVKKNAADTHTADMFFGTRSAGTSATSKVKEGLRISHDQKVTISNAYTLPSVDGTANYFLQTDGLGNVSWAAASGSGLWTDNTTRATLNTTNFAEIGSTNTWTGVYTVGNAVIGDSNTLGAATRTVSKSLFVGNSINIAQNQDFISSILVGTGWTHADSNAVNNSAGFGSGKINGDYDLLGGNNNEVHGDKNILLGDSLIAGTAVAPVNNVVITGRSLKAYASDQILWGKNFATNASWAAAAGIYGGLGTTTRATFGFFQDPGGATTTPANFVLGGDQCMRTDLGALQSGCGSALVYLMNYTDSKVVEPTTDIPDATAMWAKDRAAGVKGVIFKDEGGDKSWIGGRIGANQVAPTATVHGTGEGATSGTTSILIENSASAKLIEGKNDSSLGFFAATPVTQPNGTGETVGFTAGVGTGVNDDSTFTGNVGATAYRISDIVKALKNLGFLAQ